MNDANLKSPQSELKRETLADVIGSDGLFVDGDWVESKDQDPDGDVRLVQLADIGDGEYRDRSSRFLTSEKARLLKCSFIQPGDVLIARMPDPLGRACIFPGDKKRAVTVVDVAIVRVRNSDVDPRWLMYCVNSPFFRRAVSDLQSGSTRQRISRKNLSTIDFLRPSHDEQLRVVAEIEKQFSRLDEAVANLKRVKANLKRYKAAVLKSAVEGRLVTTEATLAKSGGHTFESGQQLLRSVLDMRRNEWDGKGSFPESIPVDTSELPALPYGWTWVSAAEVCEVIASGSTPVAEKMMPGKGEVPFLKVYNLTFGDALDFTVKPTFIERSTHEGALARSRVRPGDVLMNIVGPPLGKISVVDDAHPEWNINQAIVTFRTSGAMNNLLLANWLLAEPILRRLIKTSKATAGQSNLQVSTCRKIPLPLPPIAEQRRIVLELERRLSLIKRVESEADVSLRRAERMRQAILGAAFSLS